MLSGGNAVKVVEGSTERQTGVQSEKRERLDVKVEKVNKGFFFQKVLVNT